MRRFGLRRRSITAAGLITLPAHASAADVVAIAEIQGTGDASPLAGSTVTTDGRRHRGLPDRRLQRLLPPDRRHRRRRRPRHPPGVRRRSSCSRVGARGRRRDRRPRGGDRQGQRVPRAHRDHAASRAAWTSRRPGRGRRAGRGRLPAERRQRETLEGMLLAPQGDYTVTDNYRLNQYAEIGLAAGDQPLHAAHRVVDARGAAAYDASWPTTRATARDARRRRDAQLPRRRQQGHPAAVPDGRQRQIRVGRAGDVHRLRSSSTTATAPGSSSRPQQLTPRRDRVQPATFGSTREAAPEHVGGDVKIASFNVLNYFTDDRRRLRRVGGGTCTYFNDRDGDHVTVNSCTDDGPRGAAERRQPRASAGQDRHGDQRARAPTSSRSRRSRTRATSASTVTTRLATWSTRSTPTRAPTCGRSSPPADAGCRTDEDVIRTAFIYQPDGSSPSVTRRSSTDPAFDNARDPLAQAFQPAGGAASTTSWSS